MASADSLLDAWNQALACDSVSAFGGIVAVNRKLDGPTAEAICGIFTEVVVAPEADEAAIAVFGRKKNLRLLLTGGLPDPARGGQTVAVIAGGLLIQDRDNGMLTRDMLKVVTKREPNEQELKGTSVLRLPLVEVSAKIRTGPPKDDEEDYAIPVWAGELPLRIVAGTPVPDPQLAVGIAVHDHVAAYSRSRREKCSKLF